MSITNKFLADQISKVGDTARELSDNVNDLRTTVTTEIAVVKEKQEQMNVHIATQNGRVAKSEGRIEGLEKIGASLGSVVESLVHRSAKEEEKVTDVRREFLSRVFSIGEKVVWVILGAAFLYMMNYWQGR